MKKTVLAWLVLAAAASAQEPVAVKVLGDRVSLRAAPESNAVLLAKAMLNDKLDLRDNTRREWVGVLPPKEIDLWVSAEFVRNSAVIPETLNIRSGPSLSHPSVGMAVKGEPLSVRGEAGGWLKIAPTSNTTVWISRRFVDAPVPQGVEPVAAPVAVQQADPPPAAPEIKTVAEPTAQEILESIRPAAASRPSLDPGKPQGAEAVYAGVLQPAEGLLYKLTDDHFTDVTVCFVRGNSAQMKTFTGMNLEITGKTYWADGLDLPVIRPVRIRLLPQPVKR